MKNSESNKVLHTPVTPKHVNQPTENHTKKDVTTFEPKAKGHLENNKSAITDVPKKEIKGSIDSNATTKHGEATKKNEEKHTTLKV